MLIMDVETICDKIKDSFDSVVRQPAKTIPGILLMCSFAQRPGLSSLISTAKIISDLSRRGIPTDDMPDGQPNYTRKLVNSIVEEVYRAIKEDMNIQIGMDTGAVNVSVVGGNAGGAVTSYGTNVGICRGGGIPQ